MMLIVCKSKIGRMPALAGWKVSCASKGKMDDEETFLKQVFQTPATLNNHSSMEKIRHSVKLLLKKSLDYIYEYTLSPGHQFCLLSAIQNGTFLLCLAWFNNNHSDWWCWFIRSFTEAWFIDASHNQVPY